MKRAIFFAINRYPAPTALAGCITDAYCWQGLLAGGHGLPCSLVLDENCTTERMRDEIAAAVASTKSGDTLLLGYSGHGAILGDGWYASDLAFTGKRKNYGGDPRLLVQLVIELADGSTQTLDL